MSPRVRGAFDAHVHNAIAALDRAGASKYFWSIRKRKPGEFRWVWFRQSVPIDEIDDIASFCHNEGGEQYDYKIRVHDDSGKAPKGPDGQEITERVISAIKGPDEPSGDGLTGDDLERDRIRQSRRRRLEVEAKRQEIEMRKQEADLRREEERLRRQEESEQEYDDGYDDVRPQYRQPMQMGMMPGMGMGGYWNGFPGFMPPQPHHTESDSLRIVAEIAKALAPILQPQRTSPDLEILKIMLPLMAGNKGFEPKDMLGFVGPIITQMATAGSDANRLFLDRISETDGMFREKMIELIKVSGADDDEVARITKIVDAVANGGNKVIRSLKGLDSEKRVEVPRLPGKKAPGLPGAAPAQPPAAGQPPQKKVPLEKADPEEMAKTALKERIDLFLLSHEQELIVGSDPGFVAEKLEEVWNSLPRDMTDTIINLPIDKKYDTLKQHSPEIVDRILTRVAADASGKLKTWCEDFWDAMVEEEPEEEPGEGDDDGGDEPPEEPEPQPEPPPAEKSPRPVEPVAGE